MKKFEMNQLNYRFSHPVAALQNGLVKDVDKFSRIRFDYASFDAQVFGKQPLLGTNQDQDMPQYPDCKSCTKKTLYLHFIFLKPCLFLKLQKKKLVFSPLCCLGLTPGVPLTKCYANCLSFSTSAVSWRPWSSRWPPAHLRSTQPAESIQERRRSPGRGSDSRHSQPLHPLPEEHGDHQRPALGILHKGNQIRKGILCGHFEGNSDSGLKREIWQLELGTLEAGKTRRSPPHTALMYTNGNLCDHIKRRNKLGPLFKFSLF